MLRLGSAITGLVGGVGFGLLIRNALKTGDALAKTADMLGLSTEALVGLQHAAKLSGVESNTFDMALQRMTRRLSEAAHDTGEAKAALKELGIDAKRTALLSPDKAFMEIADAMMRVSNQSDRVRLAFKLFDSEGVAVVNMLARGRVGLEDAAREAAALGTAISRVEASRLERLNEAMWKLGQATKGLALRIAIQLAPLMEWVANAFVKWRTESNNTADTVTRAFNKILEGIKRVADDIALIPNALINAQARVADSFATMFDNIDGLLKSPMGKRIALALANMMPDVGNTIGNRRLIVPSPAQRAATPAEYAQGFRDLAVELRAAALGNVPGTMPSEIIADFIAKVYKDTGIPIGRPLGIPGISGEEGQKRPMPGLAGAAFRGSREAYSAVAMAGQSARYSREAQLLEKIEQVETRQLDKLTRLEAIMNEERHAMEHAVYDF